MKGCVIWVLSLFLIAACSSSTDQTMTTGPITLVIHGGAGRIVKGELTPAKENAYRHQLINALEQGFKILEEGGESAQAVVAAIQIMEASPLFNAGKGSVRNRDGVIEMDASIMEGKTSLAGAVAGVRTIKSPITAAYKIMTESPYVMLVAKGAQRFAAEHGIEIVPPTYFHAKSTDQSSPSSGLGTVGAVALDRYGNLAAGTSTGGTPKKHPGRVGDSAIIGAGTYADNRSCAISATGHGEFFIRQVVGHEISARMKYRKQSLARAAEDVIQETLKPIGGKGGVIGLDRAGNIAMVFNTEGMYRGYMRESEPPRVYFYQ